MRPIANPLLGMGLGISVLMAANACGSNPHDTIPHTSLGQPSHPGGAAPALTQTSPQQQQLASLTPAQPSPPSDTQTRLGQLIDEYHQYSRSQRLYVHLDKPLYQPGETIWFRIWELNTPTLTSNDNRRGMRVQLISPKGAAVLDKRIRVQAGVATNDFTLPATVQGGEYTIRVHSDSRAQIERKVMVSQYQPPRIKKKVEFMRKAYGPGDKVVAALQLNRATGEALAKVSATAIVTVDEVEVTRFGVTTDAAGKASVRFELPGQIARGDGLLTVLVTDGGATESIQKRVPILLKQMNLELYPEGGDLVTGLPGRVYFAAKNTLDKPADIEGQVVDDRGTVITPLASFHNGLGRFELTPGADRRYFVQITKPTGIDNKVPLPAIMAEGCSIQAVDDPLSKYNEVRFGIWCSEERAVIATAVLREKRLGDIAITARPDKPTVVSIPVPVGAQGAVRVTVFDDQLQPLAERLVYRNRGADLRVKIAADKTSYTPRSPVGLTITTTDLAGKPVQAELSLAVVDDTVLSFADDKTAHLLASIYLESEMPGQEIEEPNFYFSDHAKAPYALDLVLGTQGWRRFHWEPVLESIIITGADPETDDEAIEAPEALAAPMAPPPREAQRPRQQRPAGNKNRGRVMRRPARPKAEKKKAAAIRGERRADKAVAGRRARRRPLMKPAADMPLDRDWNGAEQEIGPRRWQWAPVRVFPKPNYEARYDGPRTDFRETIHWQPAVTTDQQGQAQVSFYTSDAITSFRAVAEGVSRGGLPGRGEVLVQSKLPVSLAVQMPLAVSAGDTIHLPVTLSNETEVAYTAEVMSDFGNAFKVKGGVPARVSLQGGQRKTFFATLEVVGNGKRADDGLVKIGINTANLKDEVARTINVAPLGFVQQVSLAGTLDTHVRHEVNLAGALPGTIEAGITMYPSPLATMIKGTEAIIREPHGCFEQASSANYPNIMVLSYLEEHEAADPALVERAQGMLDRGYKKIAGYESPKRGYEWFGGDPGHEALTAYGLMEFADMRAVYSDVDSAMVARTKKWLRSRRDGKGGFKRSTKALDSFGRASAEVTNGYITYALTETGATDLKAEIAYQKQMAMTTRDPYLMALASNVLANVEPRSAATQSAIARLAKMQGKDGSFSGADHSITRSGGLSLNVETTSLAALALMKVGGGHDPRVRQAIAWLNANRSGHGGFGATQATILSLKAMTAYASATRATRSGGTATLLINGTEAGRVSFAKGHKDPLVFGDVVAALRGGKNVIEIKLDADDPLPYSVAISYRSKQPASSANAAVAVKTALSKSDVPVGESVRMKVSVANVTDKGQPMTLARVGIPGGLSFQTWQLKELVDKKIIDFFETREREVVLYFRSLAPEKVVDVDLDLLARVPGEYVAPASNAYLYYTDEFKHWVEPVTVEVSK